MSDLVKHHRQLVGIANGWAAKNLPGWCDETHRDLLARHGAAPAGGRVSASTMTVAQLGAVLDDYERRGWPRTRKVFSGRGASAPRKPVPADIALLVKLWGKLGTAGKVGSATRPALLAWCGRQVGRTVADLDSLAVEERQAVIEAAKSWLARER